jgi:hypothetical protein
MRLSILLALVIFFSGCTSPEKMDIEEVRKTAYQEGYSKALAQIDIQQAQALRGEMLACRAYQFLPVFFQNLAGLECGRDFSKVENIETVASDFPYAPALFALGFIFLLLLFLSFFIPSIFRLAGTWRGAVLQKFEPTRLAIEAQLRADIEKKIESLESRRKALIESVDHLQKQHDLAAARTETANERMLELELANDQLKADLERRLELAKNSQKTAELGELISAMGRSRRNAIRPINQGPSGPL